MLKLVCSRSCHNMSKFCVHIKYSFFSGEEEEIDSEIDGLLKKFINLRPSKLKSFEIRDQNVKFEDFKYIVPILPFSLNSLTFSNINMLPKSVFMLAKQLERSKIESLDLSMNLIGDESIWMLVGLISQSETLKSINISECGITSQGIWPLVNAISIREFHALFLSNNDLGSQGAHFITEYLKLGPSISFLALDNCDFSEIDMIQIIEASLNCKSLQKLSLFGNSTLQRIVPPYVCCTVVPMSIV